MPKQKAHRSAAKRFRTTGSGKVARRKAFRSHILTKKSSRRKRRLGRPALVAKPDRANVRRMLGG